ncbi:MAG: VOC family protein, partial [Gammaproteobacteria bacterium]|nr:VOC family protein [Gammaproteobacteria bacterium]
MDHIGLVGPSMAALRRGWLDAGFSVTEPETLMALDPATGRRVSLGQQSCHIVLERGYIELTAVDAVTPQHHLYPWIRSGVSLGIIAFGAGDLEAVHRRLLEAELPAGPLARASRPIRYGTRRGDALFTWFALGAASTPESLVCFVRNERPELVYQPEVQRHPNGARALEGVVICSDEPDRTAARYAGYAGTAAQTVAPGLHGDACSAARRRSSRSRVRAVSAGRAGDVRRGSAGLGRAPGSAALEGAQGR